MSERRGSGPPGAQAPTEKPAVRMVSYLCPACRQRMGAAGYRFNDLQGAPRYGPCLSPALCGFVGELHPTEVFKPRPKFHKRTGAGERARAGRR